uniref:MHC class II beta chain N-terminal domain-containing protein n=1 Tax=Salvator merianae TaxID=96440 RepID=A0A8D0BHA2_SALMN
ECWKKGGGGNGILLLAVSSECPSFVSLPSSPPEHFLYQLRGTCHFLNGTQRVQYVQRYFWGQQETVRYDSQVGKFEALTELGRRDAEKWNRDLLPSMKANMDCFCRHNYGLMQPFAQNRRGEAGEGGVGWRV